MSIGAHASEETAESTGTTRSAPVGFNAYIVPVATSAGQGPTEPNDYLFVIRTHLRVIAALSLVGLLLGFGISFGLPRNYRADVVAVPAGDNSMDGAARNVSSQLGGLGSLIGSSLPSGINAEFVAELKSKALIQRFITLYGLQQQVLERHGFARLMGTKEPSLARAVRRFDNDIRAITEDRRTGVITLTIEWPDRQIAAAWANDFIKLANDMIRERTIQNATRTLDYLEKVIEKTSVMDLRQTLYSLVEAQQRTLALAETRPDYAFRVIDPATPADPTDRVGPRRAVVALLGLLACLFGSSVYFVVRHRFARQ